MTQTPQAPPAQNLEAARAKIHRLVEEIAALAKQDLRSEVFFNEFLSRAVQATDARGGAIWLTQTRQNRSGETGPPKTEFQLASEIELEATLFHSDDAQRSLMLRALGEVVATKRPAVIASESGPEKGSLAAHLQGGLGGVAPPPVATTANRCPYPILQVPLLHNETVA
jgi:hypothetical protein